MNRLQSKLEKIESNPQNTAKTVGLKYTTNRDEGYFRIKKNNSTFFIDQNKKRIKDKAILSRIKSLVIPPAWEKVWIAAFENGHLQATGIDAKGRKQYRYHPNWNKIRNQSKFHRLLSFAKALPLIRKQVAIDLKSNGLPYQKVVALVVQLMAITNIRIGNTAYKKLYGSFGLTTLQDKHVKFQKSKIYFQFIGKKGIKHNISLESKKLLNLVKKWKEIPGQDLFQYYDDDGKHHVIGLADINNYLKQITHKDFTAKDFRVWSGSLNALTAFLACDIPKNATETKHKVIEVLDFVASKLGNTRTVCKKYYVHPTIIASYVNGALWKYKLQKSSNSNHEELVLLHLLKNENIAEVLT
jgi:DNA topoisomerase-1